MPRRVQTEKRGWGLGLAQNRPGAQSDGARVTAILRVLVRARASRNKVDVSREGEGRIYVTAAPEAGKANDAIIALLAKALGGGEA